MKILSAIILIALLIASTGCNREEEERRRGLGFEEYVPQYNSYIETWLQKQLKDEKKTRDESVIALEKTEDELEKKALQSKIEEAQKRVDRYERRLELGDYFVLETDEEIPDGLTWYDGLDQPELGDPKAKKGGVFTYFISSFPSTLRPYGDKSNNSFRGNLYYDMEVFLISLHKITGEIMPGIAKEWAFSEDGRSAYFKLHEDASYSDGVPVKAADFLVTLYLQTSNYIVAPYYKQYFREEFAQWVVYDDHTLGVTFPEPKPPLGVAEIFLGLTPSAPHFYDEYGPDYQKNYQWRVPPTTSAYYVRDEDVVKGESITLTRAKDWWAKDKKFYQYRYNPDKIVWRVVRDRAKVFELFRSGEMDMEMISSPKAWYQQSEISQVHDGYMERHWWYNQFPRPPWGLYLNTAKAPLDDRNVRLGFAHAMNWEKVINVIFWGDFSRLQGFVAGYGDWVNGEVKPHPYSVTEARRYFEAAGYTEKGGDGILRKPDGTRLELEITHATSSPIFTRSCAILKEEAKAVGLDLILNGLDSSVSFKHMVDKKHQVGFMAWNAQPPYFSFYEFFHSKQAYDEKGLIKLNTNNIYSYANPEMDVLCENYRTARTTEEKKELGLKIQKKVYDECLFVPGWVRDFERIVCWRWLRWPDTEEVQFCPPITSYPYESYTFWIDEEMKEETLKAMADGETFPEVENVVEMYRKK